MTDYDTVRENRLVGVWGSYSLPTKFERTAFRALVERNWGWIEYTNFILWTLKKLKKKKKQKKEKKKGIVRNSLTGGNKGRKTSHIRDTQICTC